MLLVNQEGEAIECVKEVRRLQTFPVSARGDRGIGVPDELLDDQLIRAPLLQGIDERVAEGVEGEVQIGDADAPPEPPEPLRERRRVEPVRSARQVRPEPPFPQTPPGGMVLKQPACDQLGMDWHETGAGRRLEMARFGVDVEDPHALDLADILDAELSNLFEAHARIESDQRQPIAGAHRGV